MTTVIPLASHRAAPLPASAGATDPIQLHAEAHNALAMALQYMCQSSTNVPGAARKAVQALAALRRIEGTQGGAAWAPTSSPCLGPLSRPSCSPGDGALTRRW